MAARTDIIDNIEAGIDRRTLERVAEAQEQLPGWTVSAVADGDSLWWEASREGQLIQRAQLSSLVDIAQQLDGRPRRG